MTVIEERPIAQRHVVGMRGEPTSNRFEAQSADSSLTFYATSSLFPVYGRSTELSGYVEAAWQTDGRLAPAPAPRMHLELKVESLRTGNELQDREMWRLIDSKRFPKISADLWEVGVGTAAGRYPAAGQITLAGLGRRYEGELNARRDGDVVTVEGDVGVDVREFGLKPMNLLVLSVEPLVRVRLRLVAKKNG